MTNHKKATIAAMAGVIAYIKSGEEAACAMGQAPENGADQMPDRSFPQAKPWGVSGRQAQMNTRFLMQMKAFH
jgi:hypothetical protein